MHKKSELPIIDERLIKLKLDSLKKSFDPSINRVQSATSVKTFIQCPRKYHYVYNLKLAQSPSIHLVRGKIMHSVKEDFFKIEIDEENTLESDLTLRLTELFEKKWDESIKELEKLDLSKEKLKMYYDETKEMHLTWLKRFVKEIELHAKQEKITLIESFKQLTPQTEVEMICKDIGLKCYIDTRLETRQGVDIGDYKSSNKADVEEHKLQMSFYALAEYITTGTLPRMMVVDFFKHGKRYIEPNQDLLIYAIKNLEEIHECTKTRNADDYPKNPTPLCKWSNARGTGQCDYYEKCFVT